MDIEALLGSMTVEDTQELVVEALSILSVDDATEAIVTYADAELEELAETLADKVQEQAG